MKPNDKAVEREIKYIERILLIILKSNGIGLVDTNLYSDGRYKIPKGREVSYRWLARKLQKALQITAKEKEKEIKDLKGVIECYKETLEIVSSKIGTDLIKLKERKQTIKEVIEIIKKIADTDYWDFGFPETSANIDFKSFIDKLINKLNEMIK